MSEQDDLMDAEASFFADGMSDIERRKWLERTGRIAAEIEIDLETGGPLGLYAKSRRNEAMEALRILADIDPRDAIAIAEAQAIVREYLRVFAWVAAKIEEAAQATETIKRDYDDDPAEQD